MATNEHHEWLKKRDWPAVQDIMCHPDRDVDLIGRKYKERDEHGRLPHHWLAAKAQTHIHIIAYVGIRSASIERALITRDSKGEIISLFSLIPEEAHSLVRRGCSACTLQC